MATYYWGGGSGTWSSTALTNWYTDAGRTTLATVVPGLNDDVIFDSASSATLYTVTMSNAVSVRNITISAPASGTVTISTSVTLTVYGDFTAASTNVTRSGTGGTTFRPPSGTSITVTPGSYSFYGLDFIGADSTSTINLGGAISAQAAIVYSSGNLNTNNFNITGGSFSISGTTAKTFTSGSSTITTTYGGDTRWSIVLTNLTYDLSATTIYNNSSVSFSGGGAVYGTVTFVSTSQNISGSSTYGTLNIGAGTGNIAFAGNNTIGTLNFAGSVNNYSRKRFLSSVPGTQRTLTITNATGVQNLDFSDIVIAGITLSGTNLGDIGNNSGITFGASRNIYMVGTTLSADSYSTSPSGSAIAGLYPLAQDNLIFTDAAIASGAAVGAVASQVLTIKNLDFSSRTLPISFFPNANLTLNLTGDYVHSSAVTTSSGQLASFIYFIGPNDQKIVSAGKLLPTTTLVISKSGGQVIQNDSLNVTSASVNIWSGSLNMNGYTITALWFRADASSEPANGLFGSSRTLNSGGGAIYITGNSNNFLFTTTVITIPTITDVFFTYTGSVGIRTFRSSSIGDGLKLNFHVLGGTDGLRLGNSTFACRDLIISNAWTGALTPGSTNIFRKVRIPPNRTYSTWIFSLQDINNTSVELDLNESIVGSIGVIGSTTTVLNLTQNIRSAGTFTPNATLNTNNYNIDCVSLNGSSTVVRTWNLGSSTITLNPTVSSPTPIAIGTTTNSNLTINPGTSRIVINLASTVGTGVSLQFGGRTFNIIDIVGSGSNSFSFTGSATINEFNVKVTTIGTTTINFPNITSYTFGKFTTNSALGRNLYMNGTSTITFTKSGGGFVDLDYVILNNISASPANTWYAGTHSTRTGTTTNWISNYRLKPKAGNFLGFF